MTQHATYTILGIVVAALFGSLHWQYRQGQQNTLKMQLLDNALQVATRRDSVRAAGIVKYIEASVAKNLNQARDVYVLRLSQQIQAKTDSAVRLFPVMRKLLSSNEAAPNSSMRTSEVAVQIQRNIKEYLAFIKPFDSDSLFGTQSELGLYNAGIAARPNLAKVLADAHEKQALYSGSASPAIAMAMLTQQEYALRLHELNALDYQAQKVGTTIDSYVKIGAFATAESNSIAAGEVYKAQLFITGAMSGLKTRMTVNGKLIDVGLDGRGRVAFRVPATAAMDKSVQTHWDGAIRVAFNGRDSTLRIRVPYTIRPARD